MRAFWRHRVVPVNFAGQVHCGSNSDETRDCANQKRVVFQTKQQVDDVDWRRGELSVIRSIVFGVVGRCKTESSQKPVPLHPLLREALSTWKETCKFTGVDDWIFASRLHKGGRPYWGASILRKYVRPVAEALNIPKRIGWHTFRHTYSTLLRSVGAEFKVMQELMRHSTLRTTMDVYTQAVAPAKQAAQAAVLALFFPMTNSMTDSVDNDSIIGTA